jgi:hypothetical protein
MRQIHTVTGPTHIKHACAHCRKTKSRCQGGSPCSECLRRGIRCSLNRQVEVPSPPIGGWNIPPSSAGRFVPEGRFLDLYFKKFHPYWLFVHRGSFDKDTESPLLVQAMVVIGMWMSEEPNARSAAIDLHNTLASAIIQQRVSGIALLETYCTNEMLLGGMGCLCNRGFRRCLLADPDVPGHLIAYNLRSHACRR